jgi:hypothetical protein
VKRRSVIAYDVGHLEPPENRSRQNCSHREINKTSQAAHKNIQTRQYFCTNAQAQEIAKSAIATDFFLFKHQVNKPLSRL